MTTIYFDNNATTMVDPRVVEVMLPHLREQYANPSSLHRLGQQARHAVETAREQVATSLGVQPRHIVFASGGTEANHLAIRGVLRTRAGKRHLVTTAIEHDSVLRPAERLAGEGYRVTYLGVDTSGRVDPAEFQAALSDDTALASVMHANNETGIVQPIEEIGRIAANRGVPLHVDAVQTVGKLPLDVRNLPVQLLTLAAHKFHGPKGVGALYVAPRTRLHPDMVGGHQERDLRAGTENVAAIVGMAEALRLAVEHLEADAAYVAALRDRLESGILEAVSIAQVNGSREYRVPNTTNIGFEALEAEAVLMLLSNEGICVSSGAACSSGSLEPSHVLRAMGIDPRTAHGAVRFSLSRFNTAKEVEAVLDVLPRVVARLHEMQPREPAINT